MKTLLLALSATILVAALVLALDEPAVPAWTSPTLAEVDRALEGLPFDEFVEVSYRMFLLRDPETLTALGISHDLGVRDDRLNNYSQPYVLETNAIESLILGRLHSFAVEELSPEQAATYAVCEWYWEDAVRGHASLDFNYPVSFLGTASPHGLTEYTLSTTHPFDTEDDVADYLARLSKVGEQFDQIVSQIDRTRALGIIAPRRVLEWALPTIRQRMTTTARRHIFYTTLEAKAAGIAEITSARLADYKDAAVDLVDTVVKPAYQRLYAAVVELLPHAPDALTIRQYPGGRDAYAYLLQHYTHTDLTPAEIHQLGQGEVRRIQDEIYEAAAALGIEGAETMRRLYAELTAQAGVVQGEEAISEASRLIEQAGTRVAGSGVFLRLPRAEVVAAGVEHGEYYSPPSLDGSVPGVYYVTTARPLERYKLPSVAYHETIPGHHLQISLAQELELPLIRRDVSFTPFAEGWALYAERLMWELGAYEDDPYGNLGRLQYELLRAARLVVDTGIHDLGWDYDRAVGYLMETTGDTEETSALAAMRYAVIPAQATAYMIGMLELLDLRAEAERSLGSSFDLAAFHDLLLENGSVPLPFFRQQVRRWIEECEES